MITELNEVSLLKKFGFYKIVAAIGAFDGIHIGHREIIKRVVVEAKEHTATPVVITFNPHPRHFINRQTVPKLLRSQKSKLKLLEQLGIEVVVTLDFNQQIYKMAPEQFIEYLTNDRSIELKAICVGENWKFGAQMQGNVKMLAQLAIVKGFQLYSVKQVLLDGTPVSSTMIREELASGNFYSAYKMLNCDYKMEGTIKKSIFTTKCVIDYGIVPNCTGVYKVDLITGGKTVTLNVTLNTQNFKENSLYIDANENSWLKESECVEIFFRPFK